MMLQSWALEQTPLQTPLLRSVLPHWMFLPWVDAAYRYVGAAVYVRFDSRIMRCEIELGSSFCHLGSMIVLRRCKARVADTSCLVTLSCDV